MRAWHAELAGRHPSTATQAYRLLSQIMRTAVADEAIARSPCQVRAEAAESAPERPTASVGEVAALAEEMPEHLRKVGVRELRNNLSRYLDRVREGTEVIVTEHGRAVAKVVPIESGGRPSGLDELIAEGLASPARRADRSLPGDLILATSPVSPLVAEQRR